MSKGKFGSIIFLVLLAVLFSISIAKNERNSTASNKIVFKYREFHRQFENCTDPSKCPTVDMCYPEIVSAPTLAAMDSINKYIEEVLINGPPDNNPQRGQRMSSLDELASEVF